MHIASGSDGDGRDQEGEKNETWSHEKGALWAILEFVPGRLAELREMGGCKPSGRTSSNRDRGPRRKVTALDLDA